MKKVSATEARKGFFKLLDRAVRGEAVFIERGGTLLRLVVGGKNKKTKGQIPDYKAHISGSVDRADRWSWDWEPRDGLTFKSS